jgi:hypothetical protein
MMEELYEADRQMMHKKYQSIAQRLKERRFGIRPRKKTDQEKTSNVERECAAGSRRSPHQA